MEESSGTIKSTSDGGTKGIITQDGTGTDLEFINPTIPNPAIGDRYNFFRIIQGTPNGDKVVNILKNKIPR